MYKKTLLSLAVASTLTLTGCLDSGREGMNADPENRTTNPVNDGKVWPVFNPITSELPIPNDLIFDTDQKDGTFGVTPDPTSPPVTALNELSGASLVAPIDIAMSGFIDASTVNATEVIISDGKPIPNPAQTVFLLELEYASGDPLTGLSGKEIPTVWNAVRFGAAAGDPASGAIYPGGQAQAGLDLGALAQAPAYEAVVQEFDGTSFIRINPMRPLDSRKRYVVVISDGVKDAQGESIVQSSTYANITDETQLLGSSSLQPVRDIMNGLWEKTAAGYFSSVANLVRPTAPLGTDNIAMSYSFMTSDDTSVPYYIANPNYWITDRVTDLVKNGATAAALAGGATDFSTLYTAVQTAYMTWLPSSLHPALAGCDAAPAGESRFDCAGTNLYNALEAGALGFTVDFPNPNATTPIFDPATARDALQTSALMSPLAAGAGWGPGTVTVVDGTITVPYYLGMPNGADGSPIVTNNWVADDSLATQLNTVFADAGLVIPQADTSVSTAVNYIFPFPKKTADVTIPVLAMYPTTATLNTGSIASVMFQHGIQTDRSAALAYGVSMVAGAKGSGKDLAVIAIDQPLHGISPSSTTERLTLAEKLLTAGGVDTANAQAVVDGTFSVGVLLSIQDAGCPLGITDPTDSAQIAAATAAVMTGTCGATAQTSLGTALVLESTVANTGSIVAGISPTENERHFNFTADATKQPVAMDYDPESALGASGSLFINLSNFLASRDNLRQQITDLLTVRLSLANMDLDGGGADLSGTDAFFIGHSLGTVNGIPFAAVANDNAATAFTAVNMLTPGGSIVRLMENSSVFAPAILEGLQAAAGLTQGDADLEKFFNILQATLDSADGVNYIAEFADENYKILLSEVIGDTYIPNSAYPEAAFGNASPSPTAGGEPLISLARAISTSTSAALTQNAVRYTEGAHTTPVYPSSGTAEESAVFGEMVGQSAGMVATGGTNVIVTNPAVVQ